MYINSDFWKKKRVFITGGTGFLGSWLCLVLLRLGADVATFSRGKVCDHSNFSVCGLENKVVCFAGDIRKSETLTQSISIFRPNIIIHLAAKSIISDAQDNPIDTFNINVGGLMNILDCAYESEIGKIMVITSTKWNGENVNNLSAYSASKACEEILINTLKQSRVSETMKVFTLRIPNIIGGGDDGEGRLIPYCIKKMNENEIINVKNPKGEIKCVYVLKVVYLILEILEKKREFSVHLVDETDCLKSCVYSLVELTKEIYSYVQNGDGEYIIETSQKGILDAIMWEKAYRNSEDMFCFCNRVIDEYFDRKLK